MHRCRKAFVGTVSVFTGSLDLDAAEQVCGFGDLDRADDVMDVLDRLVAKSILVIDRDGEPVRYCQLMTVREYGAELLAQSGDHAVAETPPRPLPSCRNANGAAMVWTRAGHGVGGDETRPPESVVGIGVVGDDAR